MQLAATRTEAAKKERVANAVTLTVKTLTTTTASRRKNVATQTAVMAAGTIYTPHVIPHPQTVQLTAITMVTQVLQDFYIQTETSKSNCC